MNFIQIEEPLNNEQNLLNDFAVGIDLGTTNSAIAIKQGDELVTLGPIIPSLYQNTRSMKKFMGTLVTSDGISAIDFSKEILLKLKKQAETILNKSITKAVITVPANFDDNARNATKLAAKLAGFEVLRLINEPTAAALAYGINEDKQGLYLVYDFGGGTFDVSILRINQGLFQVIATDGDLNLGGDDIDKALAEFLRLDDILYARQIKEYLSKNEEYNNKNINLNQEQFNLLAKSFIDRTITLVEQALKSVQLKISDIDQILLVGGTTKIPYVKQCLEERFGKKILSQLDPDLAVALGAAIQAESLINYSNKLLLDVNALSIGLEVLGGMVEKIIHKNSPLPFEVTKYFSSFEDNQTGICFNIVQGEREMAIDCRSLAKFSLNNIPPMKAGLPKIAVTFHIDVDGLLSIYAIEERSGQSQNIEVRANYELSAEMIDQMIEDSYKNAEQDINAKRLEEIKLSLKQTIKTINQALLEIEQDFLNKESLIDLLNTAHELLNISDFISLEQLNHNLLELAEPLINLSITKKIKEAKIKILEIHNT